MNSNPLNSWQVHTLGNVLDKLDRNLIKTREAIAYCKQAGLDIRAQTRRQLVKELTSQLRAWRATRPMYSIYMKENNRERLCHRTTCIDTARVFHADSEFRVEPVPAQYE